MEEVGLVVVMQGDYVLRVSELPVHILLDGDSLEGGGVGEDVMVKINGSDWGLSSLPPPPLSFLRSRSFSAYSTVPAFISSRPAAGSLSQMTQSESG